MSDEWYYIETDIQTLHNFGMLITIRCYNYICI